MKKRRHVAAYIILSVGLFLIDQGSWAQDAQVQRHAQNADDAFQSIDENGVDLLSGHIIEKQKVLSIGDAEHPLSITLDYTTGFGQNFFTAIKNGSDFQYSSHLFGSSTNNFDGFLQIGGVDDALFSANSAQSVSYFNGCGPPENTGGDGDGTVYDEDDEYDCHGYMEDYVREPAERSMSILGKTGAMWWVIEPGGKYTEYGTIATPLRYSSGAPVSYYMSKNGMPDGRTTTIYRNPSNGQISHIVSNDGYQLVFFYDGSPGYGDMSPRPSKIVAINRTNVYCDPRQDGCVSNLAGWPTYYETHTANLSQITSTLPSGEQIRREYDISHPDKPFVARTNLATGITDLTAVWAPYSAHNIFNRHVVQVTKNGVATSYQRYVKSEIRDCPIYQSGGGRPPADTWDDSVVERLVKTYADGSAGILYFDQCNSKYKSFTDELNRSEQLFSSRYFGIFKRKPSGYVSYPGVIYTAEGYDPVGPRIEKIYTKPVGSSYNTPGRVDSSYSYNPDYPCDWYINWDGGASHDTRAYIQRLLTLCVLPTQIADAKNQTTTFTYDQTSGALLKVAKPAVNGVQPTTSYSYVDRYAWVLGSSGSYIREESPIRLKAVERTCRTTALTGDVCQGGAGDLVTKVYDYGPDSGPNNLLLRGVTVTADGRSVRTCYGYDKFGNRISQTNPNAGLGACP